MFGKDKSKKGFKSTPLYDEIVRCGVLRSRVIGLKEGLYKVFPNHIDDIDRLFKAYKLDMETLLGESLEKAKEVLNECEKRE